MRSVLVFVSPIDNRLNSGAACEDALLSGEGELPEGIVKRLRDPGPSVMAANWSICTSSDAY